MHKKIVAVLLGIFIITTIMYLYYKRPKLDASNMTKKTESMETFEEGFEEGFDEGMAPIEDPNEQKPDDEGLNDKFIGKNTNITPQEKKFSYSSSKRGNTDLGEWNAYFSQNNEPISVNYVLNNNQFVPSESSPANLASYSGTNKKITEPSEVFKSTDLLPQEMNKDWFEVMPDQITVKNRHLINVTKPIGVNTIGSSLKNPSYDIRGNPACPKFVVSPWMQSSIEPDINIKGLC